MLLCTQTRCFTGRQNCADIADTIINRMKFWPDQIAFIIIHHEMLTQMNCPRFRHRSHRTSDFDNESIITNVWVLRKSNVTFTLTDGKHETRKYSSMMRTARLPCTVRSQLNKFDHVWGWGGGSPGEWGLCEQTDTHDWKYYLSATSLAGSKISFVCTYLGMNGPIVLLLGPCAKANIHVWLLVLFTFQISTLQG